MDVTPLVKQGAQIIQSYAGGTFRVSGKVYDGPIIVTSEFTQEWTLKSAAADILGEAQGAGFAGFTVEDFAQVIALAPEFDVFLCGAGADMKFLPPVLKAALKERDVSIDIMDTGAACRTYNVLMAEGRRVVAVLLPV